MKTSSVFHYEFEFIHPFSDGNGRMGRLWQMADAIGKDIRSIGRALAKLQQAGKIKHVGSDKTGHWEVQL